MDNCLILGCGRSGTSLMAGILNEAGYYNGDNLYNARYSNPMGFYENWEINSINEAILNTYITKTLKIKRKITNKSTIDSPCRGHFWLFRIDPQVKISYRNKKIIKRISSLVLHQPFAFKDPRFSYTVSVWKDYLPVNTKFVVVFRDPSITANSIVKECKSAEYLSNMYIDYNLALQSWASIYLHIMKNYLLDKDSYIFIHYEQILSTAALPKLSKFLDTSLTDNFVDKNLRRSVKKEQYIDSITQLYKKLCILAEYDDRSY